MTEKNDKLHRNKTIQMNMHLSLEEPEDCGKNFEMP